MVHCSTIVRQNWVDPGTGVPDAWWAWPGVHKSSQMGSEMGTSRPDHGQSSHHRKTTALSSASRDAGPLSSSNRLPCGWVGRNNGHRPNLKLAAPCDFQQQNAYKWSFGHCMDFCVWTSFPIDVIVLWKGWRRNVGVAASPNAGPVY